MLFCSRRIRGKTNERSSAESYTQIHAVKLKSRNMLEAINIFVGFILEIEYFTSGNRPVFFTPVVSNPMLWKPMIHFLLVPWNKSSLQCNIDKFNVMLGSAKACTSSSCKNLYINSLQYSDEEDPCHSSFISFATHASFLWSVCHSICYKPDPILPISLYTSKH